jgi:hypothetical protein
VGSWLSVHGTKRTSRDVRSLVAIGGIADMAATSADFRIDRGCVKTRSSQGCAELFSQLPSSDRSCQCNCFPHRRNRDGNSTRTFNVRVLTQPRSKTEVAPLEVHVRSTPQDQTFIGWHGRFVPRAEVMTGQFARDGRNASDRPPGRRSKNAAPGGAIGWFKDADPPSEPQLLNNRHNRCR